MGKMKKSPILIVIAVLSIPAFALIMLAVFETLTVPIDLALYLLPRRIWLLIALSSPMAVVYGALREKFGVSIEDFLLAVCRPQIAAAIVYVMALPPSIGKASGNYGGLIVINFIFGTDLAVACTVISVTIWTVIYHNIELRTSEKTKKATAITCLVLCAAAVGASLREMTELNAVSTVIRKDKQYSLMEKILPILPILAFAGLAAAGIMLFYRKKYDLNPPTFMLCAFLPGLLITVIRAVLEKDDSRNFHTQIENLVSLAAALVFSVIFYAAIRAIQAKKRQSY